MSATSTAQRSGSPQIVSNGAEADRNRRHRRDGRPFERDVVEGQRAGEFAELRIDEDAADVILSEQGFDHPLRYDLVAIGEVDQVRSTISGHDHLRPVAVAADNPLPDLVCWPSAIVL